MSWAFSLAGGAEALFGHIAKHSAEMLKAHRGLVLLYDTERRQLVGQSPGFGFTPAQVERVRYSVDGEASARWNFRKNGPLLSNKASTDTRLLPGPGLGAGDRLAADRPHHPGADDPRPPGGGGPHRGRRRSPTRT